jgi:hypothetical protein
MIRFRFVAALATTVLVAAACTVTTTDSSKNAGVVDASTAPALSEAGADGGTDAGDAATPIDPLACVGVTPIDDCVACCQTEESIRPANIAADRCACNAGCSSDSACTSYCQNPDGNPSDACTTCINTKASQCQQAYDSACVADPMCNAGRVCEAKSCGVDAGQ